MLHWLRGMRGSCGTSVSCVCMWGCCRVAHQVDNIVKVCLRSLNRKL